MNCNKSSHNGPIEPGMVSFERLASSPVGNAQFPLFWRINEPQKEIFLSSPWESRQILPQKVDGQKLLYLYTKIPWMIAKKGKWRTVFLTAVSLTA